MTTPTSGSATRIGIISDTHGWLDPAIAGHFRGVTLILHAGDIGSIAVLEELQRVAPVAAVQGNIDGGPLSDLPRIRTEIVAGWRIALLHAAGSPSRPTAAAGEIFRVGAAQVLVCGHSHIPAAGRVRGLYWINPGAAGREGFHQERTIGLLEVGADGRPRYYRIALGPRSRWTSPAAS
jgi:hypothetical protein